MMESARQLTTWTSLLDSQAIAPAEEQEFLWHVVGNASLRDEVVADLRAHRALRMVAHSRGAGAGFVEKILAQPRGELPKPARAEASPDRNDVWSFAGTVPLSAALSRRPRSVWRKNWGMIGAAVAATLVISALALLAQTMRAPDVAPKSISQVGGLPAVVTPREVPQAKHESEPEQVQPPEPRPPVPALPQRPILAKLVESKDCQWKQAPSPELLPGILELLSGTAVIALVDGPTLELNGPCRLDLRGPKSAFLHAGQLRSDSKQASAFVLETPTTALKDHGTRADVKVTDDGATDVLVYQGELDLEARALDGTPTDEWRIGMGGHRHVPPLQRAEQPLKRGQFKGVLNVNGEVREFTNPADYEEARQRVLKELQEFMRQLPNDFFPFAPGGGLQGRIDVGRLQIDCNSPDSIREAQQRLLEQLGLGRPRDVKGVKGDVKVNGKQVKVNSPQSLDELARRLFESMPSSQRPATRSNR